MDYLEVLNKTAITTIIEIAGELRRETERDSLFFDGVKETWIAKPLGEWDEEEKVLQMSESVAMEKGVT